MYEEKCKDCIFYHRLKHNFVQGKGYTESKCCTAWLEYYLTDPDTIQGSFILEVHPGDYCEMYHRRD